MERRAEVVIIGGGSTGSSILYHLAKEGMKDILLVERGQQIAAGQTSRSTALVRTHYSHPTVAKMALLSYRYFKNFEIEVPGYWCGFVETGLLVGADSKTEHALKENVAMFKEIGIVSNFVDKDEAKKLEPQLDTSSFSTIAHEPQMGYAEPSTTASSFTQAAQFLGADVLLNTRVTSIEKGPRGGYSILTTNGEIIASKVVIATGVWSNPLFEKLGIKVRIKPVRHPVAIYRRPQEYQGNRPVIFDFPRSAYYKPEGQYLFFAGSLEMELDNYEIDPDSYNENVTFDEIMKFTQWVSEVLPVMGSGGKYERSYTGVYDVTPDQQPIIDEFSDEGFEGLYCLVGLSGHGFKLCPEFGRIMSQMVMKGKFRDYDVSIFRRKRFEEGKLLKSRYELSTIG